MKRSNMIKIIEDTITRVIDIHPNNSLTTSAAETILSNIEKAGMLPPEYTEPLDYYKDKQLVPVKRNKWEKE